MRKVVYSVLILIIFISCSNNDENQIISNINKEINVESVIDILLKKENELELVNIDSFSKNNNNIKMIIKNDDPQIICTLPLKINKITTVEVEIISNQNTFIQVFYQDKEIKNKFTKEKSVSKPIRKGRNIIILSIDYQNIGKRIRFDIANKPGEYTINKFLVRQK